VGDPGRGRGSALTSDTPAATATTPAANRLATATRAVAGSLFVAPAKKPLTAGKALLAVVAVAAAVTVGLLRQPGPGGALDTVWAEDGAIFLTQAVDKGPWAALTTSYAGYFHVVPRLLAAIAAAAPPGAAAVVLAGSAALVVALLALLVYVASAAHLTSQPARVVVAAVVVVVPVAQDEVLNSVANFHWYGLYALFWVLLWSPRGRAGQVIAVATVFLVAASDIIALVYVPLALLRAVRRGESRTREGIAMAVALALGLALQFAGLLGGGSQRELAPDPVRSVLGWFLRAVPAPLVGQRWLGSDLNARWVVLAALAWIVVAAAVVLALRGVTRPAWVLAGAAVQHSAALYVLPVFLSGVAAPRYAVAPAMLLVVALVALLQGEQRIPLYALTGLLTVIALVNLRIDNPRAHGPRWSAELDRARAACATDAQRAGLAIAPRTTPPWTVSVPCHDIE
jgi:hypothetical protein